MGRVADGSGSVCIVKTAAAGHAAAFVPRIAAAALPRDSCTGRECPPAREHLFLNPPRCPLSSLSDHVPREKALKALGATRTCVRGCRCKTARAPCARAAAAFGADRRGPRVACRWSTLTYMGQLQVAEAVLSNRAILVPGKLEAPRRDILEILDVGLLADRNKGAYARSWCNHLQQDWREEMEMKCK